MGKCTLNPIQIQLQRLIVLEKFQNGFALCLEGSGKIMFDKNYYTDILIIVSSDILGKM